MGTDEENVSRAFCRKRGLDPNTMVNVDGNGTMLPLWQVWTSDAALDAVSEAGKKVGWAEAVRVACLDDVDEALREFATDPTGDNGTTVVREVMRVMRDGYLRGDMATEAAAFRWLCDDIADPVERSRRNNLLSRMACMSYAAVCQQINHEWSRAAIAAAPAQPDGVSK